MPSEDPPYVCSLPLEVQRTALLELGEDAETRERSLRQLRKWLDEQPHLHARKDNTTLLRYLRGCKYDVPRAEAKLEMYYTCKTALPDMFKGRDPFEPSISALIRLGLMVPLPGYDAQGRRVILARLGAWDPIRHKPEALFRAASMLLDALFLDDEQMSVSGFVQLHDMTGFSLRHASAIPLSLVKKFTTTWTKGYPARPKAVHYINTPPIFKQVFNIFDKFLKAKIKSRVFLHGSNLAAMHQHIPKNLLPIEYGGLECNMSQLTDHWVSRIEAHRDWFLEDEDYGVDVSHPKGRRRVKEGFGSHMTFKRLELD